MTRDELRAKATATLERRVNETAEKEAAEIENALKCLELTGKEFFDLEAERLGELIARKAAEIVNRKGKGEKAVTGLNEAELSEINTFFQQTLLIHAEQQKVIASLAGGFPPIVEKMKFQTRKKEALAAHLENSLESQKQIFQLGIIHAKNRRELLELVS